MMNIDIKDRFAHFMEESKEYLAGLALLLVGVVIGIAVSGWWFDSVLYTIRNDHKNETARLERLFNRQLASYASSANKLANTTADVAKQAVDTAKQAVETAKATATAVDDSEKAGGAAPAAPVQPERKIRR